MPDYSQGKIYTIRSYKSDEVYVGSTTQTLSLRMSKHRTGYKLFMNGTSKYVSSYEILKFDDAYIELIKYYPCNSKTELDREEGIWIRKMECVNRRIEGRTKKQYRIDNKESIKEYKAQHYIDNIGKIKEYKTQKFKCQCGSKYTLNNKAKHFKTNKHQLYITMEKMKQEKPKSKLTKITDYYKPAPAPVNSSVILIL